VTGDPARGKTAGDGGVVVELGDAFGSPPDAALLTAVTLMSLEQKGPRDMSVPQPAPADGRRGRRIKESDRRLMRVFIGAHRRILAGTGGRILGRMGGHPLLVLTTTGQRTGQPRSTPVIGISSGRNWLIVASNGGAATQPLWLRNIAASPQVTVRHGTRADPYVAQILPGRERADWWPKLVQAYPPYARMQAKTDRELPVILLTPGATSLGA
jgi:deazaflavin-dependent oxidoreductase (nitroreductase family)